MRKRLDFPDPLAPAPPIAHRVVHASSGGAARSDNRHTDWHSTIAATSARHQARQAGARPRRAAQRARGRAGPPKWRVRAFGGAGGEDAAGLQMQQPARAAGKSARRVPRSSMTARAFSRATRRRRPCAGIARQPIVKFIQQQPKLRLRQPACVPAKQAAFARRQREKFARCKPQQSAITQCGEDARRCSRVTGDDRISCHASLPQRCPAPRNPNPCARICPAVQRREATQRL